tara:strand:+ start:305 stop:502 length:198 start_codon:yes stop_codon:yes gene_type:complete
MARFKIIVDYDDENIEVNNVHISGGYVMPSLEMSDLLTDVINDLTDKQNESFTGYVKSIKKYASN